MYHKSSDNAEKQKEENSKHWRFTTQREKKKKTPVAEVAELWGQEHSLWGQSAPIQVAALCYLGSLQSVNCLPAQLSKAAPATQVF